MRRPVLAVAAFAGVFAVAAGILVHARAVEERRIVLAADALRAELGPGGSFSFTIRALQPLRGAAVLERVRLRTSAGALLAVDRLRIVPGMDNRIDHARARGLMLRDGTRRVGADLVLVSGVLNHSRLDGHLLPLGTPLVAHATVTGLSGVEAGVTMGARSIRIDDLLPGRPATLEVNGLVVTVARPEATFRIGRIAVTGAERALRFDTVIDDAPAPRARPGTSTLRAEAIRVDRGGGRVFAADLFRAAGTVTAAGSTAAWGSLTGASVSVRAGAPPQRFGFRIRAAADSVHRSASFLGATDVPGWGSAGFGATLVDVPSLYGRDWAAIRAALAAARVARLELRLTDAGGIVAALAPRARRFGMDVATLRARLVAMIGARAAASTSPAQTMLLHAAGALLAEGGGIDVVIAPTEPLDMTELVAAVRSGPAGLDALGLRAAAIPPAAGLPR